jgi:hypothetical protein
MLARPQNTARDNAVSPANIRGLSDNYLYTTQSSTTDLVEHDGGALPWDTVLPVVVGGVHGGAAEHAGDGAGLQEKGGGRGPVVTHSQDVAAD